MYIMDHSSLDIYDKFNVYSMRFGAINKNKNICLFLFSIKSHVERSVGYKIT